MFEGYLSVVPKKRLPRVISIKGAMVGTQAAIIMAFDSMLHLLVYIYIYLLAVDLKRGAYLVQMKRSTVASVVLLGSHRGCQGKGGHTSCIFNVV